ncbi:hypothetical protein BH18CHL2_BH18CHL2_10290 [soil metagenome]
MDPHLLLIANRTCPCPDVLEEVRRRATDGEVLVVAPALNRRLAHYVSDTDAAVRAARERLDRAIGWLVEAGIEARGEVCDADPVRAIEDALAGFPATEIVISTHPPERSNWLEKDIVRRAGECSGLPIVHLVSRYDLDGVAA